MFLHPATRDFQLENQHTWTETCRVDLLVENSRLWKYTTKPPLRGGGAVRTPGAVSEAADALTFAWVTGLYASHRCDHLAPNAINRNTPRMPLSDSENDDLKV